MRNKLYINKGYTKLLLGAFMTAVLGAIKNHIPSLGGVGKFVKKNALNGAFFVAPALLAFGYKYDTSGKEVQGTNWGCGTKAVAKGVAKAFGFTAAGGASMALAAMAPAFLAGPVGVAGLAASFFLVPELIEKLLPDEGDLVNEACKKKGIDYTSPTIMGSLMGSLSGGGSVTA